MTIAGITQENAFQSKMKNFKEINAADENRKSVEDSSHNKIRNKRSPFVGAIVKLFNEDFLEIQPSFRQSFADIFGAINDFRDFMKKKSRN